MVADLYHFVMLLRNNVEKQNVWNAKYVAVDNRQPRHMLGLTIIALPGRLNSNCRFFTFHSKCIKVIKITPLFGVFRILV